MAETRNMLEDLTERLSKPKSIIIIFISSFIIIFVLAWFFEDNLPFSFDTFTVTAIVFFSVTLSLIALLTRPSSTNEALKPVDELNRDIADAKKSRVVLLALTIAIGGYVGFQAVKVIQIADRGGAESQHITALRQDVDREERTVNDISSSSDLAQADRDKLLLEAKARLDEATDRLNEELRIVDEGRRRVDGRFLFDFFSSFFVRVASVAISLTFFAVALTQYRKIDLRILELSQIKLAHLLAMVEADPALLENYRRAVSITDAQTKSLQDDTEVAIPRETVINVLSAVQKLGLTELLNKNGADRKGSDNKE